MIAFKGRTRTILLGLGALILLFLMWYFSAIVTYIILSVVLSFLGRPVVRRLKRIRIRKFTIPGSLAAFLTLILLWVVFITFFRFMIPLLINEFDTFSNLDLDALMESVQEPIRRISHFLTGESIEIGGKTFYDILQEQLSTRFEFSRFSTILGSIAGTLGNIFIGFFSISFITFFFLKEQDMFKNGVLLLVPSEMEEKVGKIMSSISYLLRRYFIGLILEVLMVMLLDTLGLTIVGIEFHHAVVIGLFCGLFNVIPYLGPWMGAFVGLLIGTAINLDADFMSYTLPLLGWMTLVFISVQVIDNILFQPLIYSSSVKAHPLEIFLVILAAGSMAGIIGMILAIPSYTILRVIAKEFFDNMKLVKKLTESLNQSNKQ